MHGVIQKRGQNLSNVTEMPPSLLPAAFVLQVSSSVPLKQQRKLIVPGKRITD